MSHFPCRVVSSLSLCVVWCMAAQVDESEEEDEEYLVDHSSFIYLIGPEGQCVDFYGKGQEIADIAASVKLHMSSHQGVSARPPHLIDTLLSYFK
jgi:cytochrome oxidase Cu insertion factor (SCO1/SenC/PrrC family)